MLIWTFSYIAKYLTTWYVVLKLSAEKLKWSYNQAKDKKYLWLFRNGEILVHVRIPFLKWVISTICQFKTETRYNKKIYSKLTY